MVFRKTKFDGNFKEFTLVLGRIINSSQAGPDCIHCYTFFDQMEIDGSLEPYLVTILENHFGENTLIDYCSIYKRKRQYCIFNISLKKEISRIDLNTMNFEKMGIRL